MDLWLFSSVSSVIKRIHKLKYFSAFPKLRKRKLVDIHIISLNIYCTFTQLYAIYYIGMIKTSGALTKKTLDAVKELKDENQTKFDDVIHHFSR